MPSTGGVIDSTIISMRPIDVIPTSRQLSTGVTTTTTNVPDDREIFKVELIYLLYLFQFLFFVLGIT
jgi:hypothetical protein